MGSPARLTLTRSCPRPHHSAPPPSPGPWGLRPGLSTLVPAPQRAWPPVPAEVTPQGGPGLRRAGRSENVKEGSRPAQALLPRATMAEAGKLQLFVKVPSCLGCGAVPGGVLGGALLSGAG